MGCCNNKLPKPCDTDLTSSQSLIFTVDNIKRHYKFNERLNQGSSSIIYSAQSVHSSEFRAVKCIPILGALPKTLEAFSQEIQILLELDHPNILKIFDVFRDQHYIYIVTEQCKGGELFDRIINKGSFTEAQAAGYMLQIVSAVVYLHSKSIMHRDLRPENIMFESESSDSLLKIIDFGSSKHFVEGIGEEEHLGSAFYVAPEVIFGEYDQKCDVWSLGVILHILLVGFPPFSGANDQEVFGKIQSAEPVFTAKCWQSVSKEAVLLIKSMLNKDPKARISAAEVFQSPWLQNFKNNLLSDVIFSNTIFENLSSFCVNNKLLKASLGFIAKHLMTSEEIANIVKVFERIDKNGDGVLTVEEIKQASEQCPGEIGLNVELIFQMMKLESGEGIKYSDFLTAAIDWNKELSKEKLRKAFSEFDKNRNGLVSVAELMKALGGSEKEIHLFEQMVKEADSDGNGELDFEEFCKFMLKWQTPNNH